MLAIFEKRALGSFKAKEIAQLPVLIGEFFPPLIWQVKQEYFKQLKLDPEKVATGGEGEGAIAAGLKSGEIFLTEEPGILFYTLPPAQDSLSVFGIFPKGGEKIFQDFLDILEDSLRKLDSNFKPEWESPEVEQLAFLSQETAAVSPAQGKELQASQTLREAESREMLAFLKEVKNIYLDELRKKFPDSVTGERLKQLEDAGLIQRDFVVLCQKTGQQILRIGSRAGIEDSAQKGLKCYICGNLLSEEKIEEIISPSEMGEKLIQAGAWFKNLVIDILAGLLFKPEALRENPETPHHIFLVINGEILLLALLVDPLDLNSAQLLNAHITTYNIREIILVSQKPIPQLLKGYLSHNNPQSKIHYLPDDFSLMEKELQNLFLKLQENKVISKLQPFDELTKVHLHNLLLEILPPGQAAKAEKAEKKTKK